MYGVCVWSRMNLFFWKVDGNSRFREDTKTICFNIFEGRILFQGFLFFEKLLGIMSVNLEINIFLMGGSTTDVLRI